MKNPAISICIPAYKRLDYLQKLLHSISIQTFRDYEVIITDDSPDDSLERFLKKIENIQFIRYYKNPKVLGTPENWNEAIRKANGTWVKLMHDDDWFVNEDSLQIFYEAALGHLECSFFFSAYNNVIDNENISETVRLSSIDQFMLKRSPLNLFKKQYVGNPSCTLIKKDIGFYYDNDFKWVVDFEYYIRVLRSVKKFYYINQVLVNVGVNEDQVTNFTFRKPEVEIPENHLMIEKMGFTILRNIFVYDYYWRFFRNLEIRNENEIKKYYPVSLHPLLKQMINFQVKISSKILKIGIVSKILMLGNYMISLFRKI